MQKYILYSFLAIFAFSPASFGVGEDKEDSPNVSKTGVKEAPLKIDRDLLLKAGRPGGLSPQTHQNPDTKYDPPNPLYTRGETFYIPKEKRHELFLKPMVKESSS